MDRVFSSYIRGQLFLGLIVGTGVGIGLIILNMAGFQVEYVLLLAVLAGVTELIPYVGPTIGATPAVILALFDSPTTAILVGLLYLGVQMLENNLLVPRIIGHSVGIHPAILMVVMVVCSQVLGFVGIILAAPLAAVIRDVFCYVHGRLSEPPRPAGLLPGECFQSQPTAEQIAQSESRSLAPEQGEATVASDQPSAMG
jgi:predicted PurR-regulated permease PerM